VLSVGVTPSTATLSIDGQPLPSNPFVGHFPKSPGVHRIRASASGYQPKERLVSFDDNVMIDLSLTATPPPPPRPTVWRRPEPPRRSEPPPRRAESPPSAPPPVAAPEPVERAERPQRSRAAGDITPRGEWETPRRRAIDTNNPYGDEK
jgi:protein TonB